MRTSFGRCHRYDLGANEKAGRDLTDAYYRAYGCACSPSIFERFARDDRPRRLVATETVVGTSLRTALRRWTTPIPRENTYFRDNP